MSPFKALLSGRKLGVIATLAFASLALAPPASSQVVQPVVDLGPITVAGDVATVTGTVGGASLATLDVKINGRPVLVNADGRFTAVVDLDGQSFITLVVRNALTGTELLRLEIPVALAGPGGVITGVLDLLERAGVSLTLPPGGLRIVDGLPLRIEGHVLDEDELASLTINGIDVLRQVLPDGSFVLSLPGTTKEVRVEATDKQGTSQTKVVEVIHYVTVPGTSSGTARCTIVGTAGADRIEGTPVRDVICALGGNDRVHAGAGADLVSGASGRDALFGQLGNDQMSGGSGADYLSGWRGRDRLFGAAGADLLRGGLSNDRLDGGSRADRLVGGAGADTFRGAAGRDRMLGYAGRDTFFARDRVRDLVAGGAGRDRARADRIDRRRSIESRF